MSPRSCAYVVLWIAFLANHALHAQRPNVVDIGSRRELLVDDFLVQELTGAAQRVWHRPEPREVVLHTDQPWEGNTSAYFTLFQDEHLFRMYYRGSHWDQKSTHPEYTCYAESKDGVHWVKPELGLFEFAGSKANNIVWNGIGTHCFAPFKDTNPAAKPEARYKAISRGAPKAKPGLYVFQSPDAIHWKLIQAEPVITVGKFDSQNIAFWDPNIQAYREYHRTAAAGKRAIMTSTSDDFIHWSKPQLLQYGDAPNEHLYTNAIQVYARAPHLYVGFPTRYLANSQVEPLFMSSRDGLRFQRSAEAVIPRDAPEDRDGNRSNYMAWGILRLPRQPDSLSVYGTEAYYTGPDSRLRRFEYRVDGFVSIGCDNQLGELKTRPLRFTGGSLRLNYKAKSGGSVRVQVEELDGRAFPGLALQDCQPLQGDETAGIALTASQLNAVRGKPCRLRFELKAANLYSFQFAD